MKQIVLAVSMLFGFSATQCLADFECHALGEATKISLTTAEGDGHIQKVSVNNMPELTPKAVTAYKHTKKALSFKIAPSMSVETRMFFDEGDGRYYSGRLDIGDNERSYPVICSGN
jgi:hypothetical protein